jgi:hypothetical protein
MRSYLLDEISPSDIKKISNFLKKNAINSGLGGIFWGVVPDDAFSKTQYEHSHNGCQPFTFAIELGPDFLRFEFLVRSLTHMGCACSGYCTRRQQEFIINFADALIADLDIKT